MDFTFELEGLLKAIQALADLTFSIWKSISFNSWEV